MKSGIFSFFKVIDILRRVIINLLFWGALIVIIAVCINMAQVPRVAEGSVLVVNPSGFIIEHTVSEAAGIFSGGDRRRDTTLRKIVAVLNEAATDDRIASVFLDLRRLDGAGLSKLQEIGAAIKRVREAGKPVVAFSDTYTQSRYYLAAHAETVVIDPFGITMFRGMGSYQNYFGRGLDRFGIKINVFRAGEYKTAVEPWISDRMSAPARRATAAFLDDLWAQYLGGIVGARNISKADLNKYISDYARILAQHRGNSAKAAKAHGIVDIIATYNEAIALLGEGSRINWQDYYRAVQRRQRPERDRIAVVVASGTIVSGTQPPGAIGASSYVSILRNLRDDDRTAAVVLRINSGGGSVAASESIRRALQEVRDAGKPVVVSMSSIAASGAYWIATASDAILCMPSTLTGSIGVFGMFPDISEFLERYPGITTDGHGTTAFSSFLRPDVSLTEDMKKILTLSIENTYNTFLDIISDSREIELGDLRRAADGRIWSGNAAVSKRLTDGTGTLEDAIALAAEKAGILVFSVDYHEPEDSFRSAIVRGLRGMVASDRGAFGALGARLHSFMADALLAPVFSMRPDNLNAALIFENIFNEIQALYIGPEYIVR
ncbi:MAG: signal peptide peptidase SppA [Spirochaetes bacterium]|nr:signal peptide peptidase SppA [Spirochaetota bacterium]